MTPDVAAAMQKGAKLNERNGDASDELPLSAAYVIAPDGTVTYAFLDADYRNRAEPARLVDALTAIKTGQPTSEHMLLQFWEGVWNPPYDIALVDRLMTENFILTSAGDDVRGRVAFKAWIAIFQKKIADLRLRNLDIFTSADGRRVTSRWEAKGRNRGMFGTSADDRAVEFTGISIWEDARRQAGAQLGQAQRLRTLGEAENAGEKIPRGWRDSRDRGDVSGRKIRPTSAALKMARRKARKCPIDSAYDSR